MSSNNNRIIQLDVLRVLAALAVVWLHTSAQRWVACYPSVEWQIRNVNDSLVRWCVPLFVMISGALFLNPLKKIDIKSLYTKNIIRIILIFLFWSFIYEVYNGTLKYGLKCLVLNTIHGPFHFWFLKMLIGLYITIPVMRTIIENKKIEQYFIGISLVTSFFFPMLFYIIGHVNYSFLEFLKNNYDEFGISIAVGYVGYFVLGHYLMNNKINEALKKIICVLGILSVFTVCFLTYYFSCRLGYPENFWYGYLNMFTFFEAVTLFVVVKDLQIAPIYHAALISASKLSLGIYIIHPLVMMILFDFFNIDSASLNPIYFIPLFAIIVFGISYLISFILNKIPFLKKFVM